MHHQYIYISNPKVRSFSYHFLLVQFADPESYFDIKKTGPQALANMLKFGLEKMLSAEDLSQHMTADELEALIGWFLFG